MSADPLGNDPTAVGIPLTGLAAFAALEAENVITKAQLGASPLQLPSAYKRLGLYKSDGGPAAARDNEEPIVFFQKGYQIAGEGTRSVVIGLAEQNANVQTLIEGRTPDVNGVIEVSSSLPDNRFILLVITKYRNGKETRKLGVAWVSAVEPDQQERGSVEGANVTFTWLEDDLFNGAPYWQWGPATPGGVEGKSIWNVAVTGDPTDGTYTLLVNSVPTAPLAYNAGAGAVSSAINALSGVTGVSGVTASGTGPIAVTFPQAVTLTATAALTGGTAPTVLVG